MSGELSGVSGNTPIQQNVIQQTEEKAKNPLSTNAKDLLQNVAAILAGNGVNVTTPVTRTDGTGTPTGPTNIPALDNPADLKQLEANLEKLLAYLQLDNDERQAQMAKERIETNKDSLSAEHKERGEKIKDSLKKMEEANRANKASRIFSWIGAALAVVAAVITTVVTGGAAAAFAIAGAAIAVTSLLLSETGAMDKMIEGLAKALQSAGMSKNDAKLAASLFINITIMAASLGCSIGGMAAGAAQIAKAAAETVSAVAKAIHTASSIANTTVGIGGLAAGIATTWTVYNSAESQADVTELGKIIAELQRRLDESEEELEAILQAIQNCMSQIVELLSSETDTQAEIASQIGQMA